MENMKLFAAPVDTEEVFPSTIRVCVTGKRQRNDNDDEAGDDGGDDDDEEEQVPAWLRYMPRRALKATSSKKAPPDDATNDARMHTKVPVKPSSNAFGPTSLRAKGQKRARTAPPPDPDPTTTSSQQQRIKDKLRRCNVAEAAALFSMSACVEK